MTLTTIHPTTGRYVRGCGVPDCRDLHVAQGLCRRHYDRWHRHGDTDAPSAALQPLTTADADRLMRLDEVRKLPVTAVVGQVGLTYVGCWRSSQDAEAASTRLLLRFTALDELAAQYDALQGTGDAPEAA